jgi:hypothetical protein
LKLKLLFVPMQIAQLQLGWAMPLQVEALRLYL